MVKNCMAAEIAWPDPAAMPATPHKQAIGWRLRTAIDVLGKSYIEVAEQFGISDSKLGNWMRGDDYPAPFFIEQFCDRYPITADWIYLGRASGVGGAVGDALWAALAASGAASLGEAPPGGGKRSARRKVSSKKGKKVSEPAA